MIMRTIVDSREERRRATTHACPHPEQSRALAAVRAESRIVLPGRGPEREKGARLRKVLLCVIRTLAPHRQ